jgi:hypothetical protein
LAGPDLPQPNCIPRAGATPAFLLAKPVYSAWQN